MTGLKAFSATYAKPLTQYKNEVNCPILNPLAAFVGGNEPRSKNFADQLSNYQLLSDTPML